MTALLEPVTAPAPTPPRLSLLGSARDPLSDGARAGERWEGGFAYLPLCGNAGRRDASCGPRDVPPLPDTPDQVGFVPYEVWAASDCPTTSGRASEAQRQELRQRALDALTLCEGAQIEAELWRGDIAQQHAADFPDDVWPNRWLASDATVDLGTGDPLQALACLEGALASCKCGARGMIHARPDLVTHWDVRGLLRTEGARLLTRNDTIVVPGAGYDGSGPGGDVPGDGSWAYATPMVDVRRGPVTVSESLDRAVNSLVYRAWRLAAATWDGCCAFGVQALYETCLPAGS